LCAGRARLLAGALRERTKFQIVVKLFGNRITEMRYESKSKSSPSLITAKGSQRQRCLP
jgi:hypothetical protein